MTKPKSKSKSKSSSKKKQTKKTSSKTKKKTSNKKCPTDKKKQTKCLKKVNDKKIKNPNKPNKEQTKKNTKSQKCRDKKLKSKSKVETILTENEPVVNEHTEKSESKNVLEELPIIMECTESDEETPDTNKCDNNEYNAQSNYSQMDHIDEINLEFQLTNEFIDENIKINLDNLVNLQDISVNDFNYNDNEQSTTENSYPKMFCDNGVEVNYDYNSSNVTETLSDNGTSELRKVEDHSIKTLQNEEVINCICGFREEDGLMIQCDVCLTWQHALCCGMNKDSDVPDNYLCIYCTQPWNVRPSQRYSYAKHILTLSKLPKFSHRTFDQETLKRREETLKKTFQLTADLRQIGKMERALTTKLSISEQPDHPKLYMWSANWDSQDDSLPRFDPESNELCIDGPIGERPIESEDCRLRLLEKIDSDQRDLGIRLALIYDKLKQIESFDPYGSEEEKDFKRTLGMLQKDLNTVATAISIS